MVMGYIAYPFLKRILKNISFLKVMIEQENPVTMEVPFQ